MRQYFDGVDDERLWVIFERDLLPGYAWVFPLPDGRANVGYGVLRSDGRSGRELKDLWPDLLARPVLRDILGPNATPSESVHAWPIPTRYEPARLVNGRVLFAGDAAGCRRPDDGRGHRPGDRDRDARGGGDRDGRRLPPARAPRARTRPALRERCCSTSCAIRSGARAAIGVADLTPWTRRNFARWMWEDYPRARARHSRPLAPRRVHDARGVDNLTRVGLTSVGAVMHDVDMAEGKAEVTIDRSPDEVWKLVREFGGLDNVDARHRDVHRRRRRPHDRDDGHRDQRAAPQSRRRRAQHLVLGRRVADGQPRVAPRDDHGRARRRAVRTSRGPSRSRPTICSACSCPSTKVRSSSSRRRSRAEARTP